MFFHQHSTSKYLGIISLSTRSIKKIDKYVKFDPTGTGYDSRGMKVSNLV
jgi:hypothetical protein